LRSLRFDITNDLSESVEWGSKVIIKGNFIKKNEKKIKWYSYFVLFLKFGGFLVVVDS
jgi:hypothetical protein